MVDARWYAQGSLQTIKKIHGRVRNMMLMPNGDKKWPLVGSLEYESFGIKRFKMVQTKIDEFELSIILWMKENLT